MRIANIKPYSQIYGFEPSFVIWTQGCPLHCDGCWNEDTWDFNGGSEIEVGSIISQIQAQRDCVHSPIFAVCILGGEPFAQYDELYQLAKDIKALNLGLICYSGYEKKELEAMQKDKVFSFIDVLIAGRYDKNLRNTNLQLRGSSNQTLHFFSNRYDISCIKEGNYMEIEIDELGAIHIFGYPDSEMV